MSRRRKPSPPAWSVTCRRVSAPHRNSQRFCVSEHEAELDLLARLAPTSDNANRAVGNEPHPVPKDQCFGLELAPGVFLCVLCNSGSARPIIGLGLRSRNPSWRKSRWHCRVLSSTPHRCLIQWLSVLPSQRLALTLCTRGDALKTASSSSSCSVLNLRGRPGRSPSTKPAKPSWLKRSTQYSTVRTPSPSSRATFGAFIPWATKRTPCSR